MREMTSLTDNKDNQKIYEYLSAIKFDQVDKIEKNLERNPLKKN